MKITFLTPGTGSYYCGACMRDNALARELVRTGHDVTLAPMYLPMQLDETTLAGAERVPVFFGGINVYLQQKSALFRKTPAWLDRLLNSTGLLRWAARHSHMTSPRELGEMALTMLEVDTGPLRKELDKLLDWLVQIEKPDVICLSTALLAGFTDELKRRLSGVRVVLFFQGEDTFLDSLPQPYRDRCWATLARRIKAADLILSPSRYYAGFMRERLQLAPDAVEVVPNGIQLDGYAVADAPPATSTIGYLARMCREKGIEILVDAFIALARDLGDTTTRLKIAGAATAGDERLIAALQKKLADAGLTARVEWHRNVSRDEKIAFLRSVSLVSVPAIYPEAFGLYVIEAMACGVPVVQPDAAAFPELIALTGGGVCVPPRDPAALARAWQRLLAAPGERAKLGQAGRLNVEKHFGAPTMAANFLRALTRFAPAATSSSLRSNLAR